MSEAVSTPENPIQSVSEGPAQRVNPNPYPGPIIGVEPTETAETSTTATENGEAVLDQPPEAKTPDQQDLPKAEGAEKPWHVDDSRDIEFKTPEDMRASYYHLLDNRETWRAESAGKDQTIADLQSYIGELSKIVETAPLPDPTDDIDEYTEAVRRQEAIKAQNKAIAERLQERAQAQAGDANNTVFENFVQNSSLKPDEADILWNHLSTTKGPYMDGGTLRYAVVADASGFGRLSGARALKAVLNSLFPARASREIQSNMSRTMLDAVSRAASAPASTRQAGGEPANGIPDLKAISKKFGADSPEFKQAHSKISALIFG